jgi:hypothetical protein
VPFGQVSRLLADFAGVTLSAETVRCQTEAAGALVVAAATAAAPALAPPADPGPDTGQRLQVSPDGAFVRVRRVGWVEVKTVAVGVVEPARRPDGTVGAHTTALSYFSRHAPSAEFTPLAVVELARRGMRAATAVAGVADGAEWIGGFFDYHRPDAVRILDLPHAVEQLGRLAAVVWGEGKEAGAAWQREQGEELRAHGPRRVLERLAALVAADPENTDLLRAAAYFTNRAEQLDYPAFGAAGWPLGSGVVESANKVVVEARLKGAGMSWGLGALNPLLGLRNAVCNDRWAEEWTTVQAGQAATRAARRRAQRGRARRTGRGAGGPAEPAGAVNGAVVAEVEAILGQVAGEMAARREQTKTVDGKPGPGHPWRRSPLGKAAR